jgi:hypothetical protein
VSNDDSVPSRFIEQKTKLDNLVHYMTEQFWTHPGIIHYLNKHVNDLYNIPDSMEYLKLIKKIYRLHKFTKFDLLTMYPKFKQDIVKEIEEREGYDEGNARGKEVILRRKFGLVEIPELYKRPTATKAAIKQASTNEDKELIRNMVEQDKEKKMLKTTEIRSKFLPKITQELIEERGLIIFDISLLKKTNRVLFTFIDKDNNKYYRIEDFFAKIYISNENCVINNDYIEELIPDKFTEYILTDIQNYTRLKYMLNGSYARILNGGNHGSNH